MKTSSMQTIVQNARAIFKMLISFFFLGSCTITTKPNAPIKEKKNVRKRRKKVVNIKRGERSPK